MFTLTPKPKRTIIEKISLATHILTIAMIGMFSLVATLRAAGLLT